VPVNSDVFRKTLGRFGSGVTVVSTAHAGEQSGLTVSAFCSVSLTPPLILVCIDKRSSSNDFIRKSQSFVVNILADNQIDVSNQFASKSEDKFSGIPHHEGYNQVPVLDNTLGSLECSVYQEIDAGDHFIFIGEVQHATVDEERQPLMYFHSQYRNF